MLERYGHGGDLRTAEESFGLPAHRIYRFQFKYESFRASGFGQAYAAAIC